MLREIFLSGLLMAMISMRAFGEEGAGFRIVGLSHIAIYVKDVEKSREFYKGRLGFEEPYSMTDAPTTAPDGGAIPGKLHLTWIKINDRQSIELFPEKEAGILRTYHMSIETDNVEALRARLAAANVKVPEKVGKGRIGNWNFTIPDPDGHLLEIVQYAPDGWTLQNAGKFIPAGRVATRLDHLVVPVTTFDHALAFYRDLLGFVEIGRTEEAGAMKSLRLRVPEGTDYLEFVLYKDRPEAEQRGKETHIGLSTPDLGKAVQILHAASSAEILTSADPDGTQIEITQSAAPATAP